MPTSSRVASAGRRRWGLLVAIGSEGRVAVSAVTEVDGDVVALSDADKLQPCVAASMARANRTAASPTPAASPCHRQHVGIPKGALRFVYTELM